LNRLGKVSHLSNNKNLILRTTCKVKPRTPVLNEELRQIGIIFDIFGPVQNPYVSIKPTINNAEQYVGRFLYTMN
jgi:rRNA processing protein Gar1